MPPQVCMPDRDRYSSNELEQLKHRRRVAAERVRNALQELEDAEREFAAATDDLNNALAARPRDAA